MFCAGAQRPTHADHSKNRWDRPALELRYDYRQSMAKENYASWLEQKKNILPFFNKKLNARKKISFKALFFISDINFLLKKILRINYFY